MICYTILTVSYFIRNKTFIHTIHVWHKLELYVVFDIRIYSFIFVSKDLVITIGVMLSPTFWHHKLDIKS